MKERTQLVNWVESIEVRSIEQNSEALLTQLKELMSSVDAQEQNLKMYERPIIKTDLAVQLFHTTNRENVEKSPLGTLIASQLKEFGLVNHHVWIETDIAPCIQMN